MKKNKLTFLIAASFLALSAMVGCDSNEPSVESKAGVESNITTSELINPSSDGGNSQSSNGGNSNSSTSQGGGNTSQGGGNTSDGGGQTTKTDWDDNDKAKMRTALHGLVLPFVNMEATVRTNNDGSSVKIESQQNMSGNFLASYAEKFTYEDGWNGGDVSYEFEVSNGNAFAYQKAVTENGKKYYVSVVFMGIEQTAGSEQINISKTGHFYLEASDPYEYEYPAAFIGQWLGQQFGTSIVPPAFDAEYYNLDSEGVLIGYSERNIEESYKSALLSSGNFTIDSARNDDGYLIARPTDGSYIMLFKYDSTNKIMILQVMENTGWNTAQINAFFIKYNKRPFDIPAFSDDNVTFKFEEDSNQPAGYERAIITIGRVTTQKVQAYVNSLKAAGYVLIDDVVTESYQWYSSAQILTDDGVCSLDLMYYPTSSPKKLEITINLFIDTSRVKAWPAAQMAAFAQASQDVVPAFTGFNNGFYVGDQGATVYVDLGEETNARDSYVSALTTAKYTLVDGHYISEHNEIDIEIVCNANKWPGQIYIIVKPYTAPAVTQWPAADISAAIATNLGDGITDTIPAINVDTANECSVNDNLVNEFEIYIASGDITFDVCKAAFEGAGWVLDAYYDVPNYPSRKGGFVSPNRQMVANVAVITEGISILVQSYVGHDFVVVGVNNVWDYHDTTITFSDATDPEEVAKGYYRIQSKATFNVVSGDKFKVTDGVAWYGIETVEEGVSTEDFAYDTDGNIVAVKAGEVNLYFKTMPDGSKKIYLAYSASNPQTVNPIEAIEEYFGEGQFGSIPWYTIEGATYEVTNYGESGGIKFMIFTVNVENPSGAFDGFISYLYNDNGFVGNPNYPSFYVKDGCPGYSFGGETENSFRITVAYFEPVLEPWPEEAINTYFGSAFDFIPEIKIAGASFSVLDTYEFEQGREFIIEATGDGIADLLDAAINSCLINQYDYYVYDEELVTTRENYPIYAFDVINDDTIYVYIVEAYDIHSWSYVKAAFEADQTGITLPDLQVDGAVSYAYNGSIDITFADDANMQDMFSAVCIKLESDGYHYSQRFMGFVNTTTDLCFRVQFSDSDEHTVSVVCSEQAFEDDGGYGILIIGYDNEGNYYYVIDDTLIGVDNPANEKEVMVLSVEFEAGTKFYIYDYGNETHFNPRLNGASLGESFNEYLEYNEATGEYLVKKNFVGDVYILIDYGNDSVYIGFVNP